MLEEAQLGEVFLITNEFKQKCITVPLLALVVEIWLPAATGCCRIDSHPVRQKGAKGTHEA